MASFRSREFQQLPDFELEETEYNAHALADKSRVPLKSVEELETEYSTEELKTGSRIQVTPIDHTLSRYGRKHRWGGFLRNLHFLWASLPFTSAMLWTTMMVYFYIYYITLPRLNGVWPRIGLSYATFPFISCVGAVRLTYFRGFSGAVAVTNILTFALNGYLMRRIEVGRFWRYLKFAAAVNSSVFLVLLSYFSVENNNRLHLIFTSIQIMATGLTKGLDTVETYFLLKVSPNNWYINRTKFVKRTAATVAFPTAILAIIGIYGCRDAVVTLSPGTTCHKLVEIAAPAEWILSGCWSIFLFAVSMEMYRMDQVREGLLLQIEKRKTAALYEAQSLLSAR